MRDQIDAFLRYLADRHAPRTLRTYGKVLKLLTEFMGSELGPGQRPTQAQIEGFLGRTRRNGDRRAPTTRNQELAALRAFFRWAGRTLGGSNPTADIPFSREAPHDPAVLSVAELRQLFLVAATTIPPRERSRGLAILALLSQTGLRVHELVGLDLGQVDLGSGTLLGVRGKGGTVHDLPLNAPALVLLGGWLRDRPDHTNIHEKALFVSLRKSRLSIRSVEALLQNLRKAMGSAKKITPHTLRHTTATLALTMGTDLATVGELLRHSDLNSTRRYLHLVDTRRREAVTRLATTVPQEVLLGLSPKSTRDPTATSSQPTLAESTKPRESSPEIPLDDQYGLVAVSPPPETSTTATNTTRSHQGARCRWISARCGVSLVEEVL